MIIRLLLTICLLPSSALALQVVDVVDGKTAPIKISQKEINRVSMADGSRIDHIWGPDDQMQVDADQASGQLFIRTKGEKPFSLFVRADNGATYTLLAVPTDIPAETVFLRPPLRKSENHGGDQAIPYTKRIEQLVQVLGQDRLPDDFTPVRTSQVIPLREDIHLQQTMLYRGESLVAEVYQVTNLSKKESRLDEREFRTLPGNDVAAVSIVKPLLQPQESTRVFIIRRAGP